MKNVIEILKLSKAYLEERKVEKARLVAEELLAYVLKLKRMDLYLQYDRPVEEGELALLRKALQRAAKGEPTDYIVGEVSFQGCVIRTDFRALIPRAETEILVDHVIRKIQEKQYRTIWDVCTGTGCVGIALKKRLPELDVTLSDLSEEAFSLALENIRLNEVDVAVVLGDLLEPFSGKMADLIVCNPPYVSEVEYQSLDLSVRGFEPKLALVGGDDGLAFYRRLAERAALFLNPLGALFLEIGETQAEEVKKIFTTPSWENPLVIADWSGKDRFFSLEKQ